MEYCYIKVGISYLNSSINILIFSNFIFIRGNIIKMKNTQNMISSSDRPLRNTITALKTQSDEEGNDLFSLHLHKKQTDFIIKRNNYA